MSYVLFVCCSSCGLSVVRRRYHVDRDSVPRSSPGWIITPLHVVLWCNALNRRSPLEIRSPFPISAALLVIMHPSWGGGTPLLSSARALHRAWLLLQLLLLVLLPPLEMALHFPVPVCVVVVSVDRRVPPLRLHSSAGTNVCLGGGR